MRFVLVMCVLAIGCGGKIDGDDGGTGGGPDGGNPGSDGSAGDAIAKKDVIVTPNCTPITGTGTVGSDGSCTTNESWSCGDTTYTIDCSCPSAQCTCSQESGGMGAGMTVQAPSLCPGCSSNLPTLCGFPTN